MPEYASHLTEPRAIRRAIAACSTLTLEIILAAQPGDVVVAEYADANDRFTRLDEIGAEVMGDDRTPTPDLRKLLKHEVDLAFDVVRKYAGRADGDEVLLGKLWAVIAEFKPQWSRHYGVEVGDRVIENGGGLSVEGEIVKLNPMDNNGATLRLDDGSEVDVVCEGCKRQHPYMEAEPSAPAPHS